MPCFTQLQCSEVCHLTSISWRTRGSGSVVHVKKSEVSEPGSPKAWPLGFMPIVQDTQESCRGESEFSLSKARSGRKRDSRRQWEFPSSTILLYLHIPIWTGPAHTENNSPTLHLLIHMSVWSGNILTHTKETHFTSCLIVPQRSQVDTHFNHRRPVSLSLSGKNYMLLIIQFLKK